MQKQFELLFIKKRAILNRNTHKMSAFVFPFLILHLLLLLFPFDAALAVEGVCAFVPVWVHVCYMFCTLLFCCLPYGQQHIE